MAKLMAFYSSLFPSPLTGVSGGLALQRGTLMHEFSHYYGDTDDYGYYVPGTAATALYGSYTQDAWFGPASFGSLGRLVFSDALDNASTIERLVFTLGHPDPNEYRFQI